MPRARRHRILAEHQISRDQLCHYIHDAIAKRGIILDREMKLTIEMILDRMPKPLDRIYLPRWCRNFVRPYLSATGYDTPLYQEIRESVRKELLFYLYRDKLETLIPMTASAKTNINPHWINIHCRGTARIIRKQFRTSEGEPDWDFVMSRLGMSHKFSVKHLDHRDLTTAMEQLKQLLTRENPRTFNALWIQQKDPRLREHFAMNYRTADDLPDWPMIIARLDPYWQKRWTYFHMERGKTLHSAVQSLINTLNTLKPNQFGSYWMQLNAPVAYGFFRLHVLTQDKKINWQVLCDMLPDVWKQRWHYRNYTFQSAIATLNKLLNEKKPGFFNTNWLKEHHNGLLVHIQQNIRTADRKSVDWQRVIRALDPQWQSKWRPRSIDHLLGIEEYEDMSEVDAVLDAHREYLYFFFSAHTPEEFSARNVICHELLRLAQKGNIAAKDTLITYVGFTIDDWIDREPHFDAFRALPELTRNRLEKCIRLYRFCDNGAPFFAYLHISLCAESKTINVKSFDQPYSLNGLDDDSTMHSFVSFNNESCEYVIGKKNMFQPHT